MEDKPKIKAGLIFKNNKDFFNYLNLPIYNGRKSQEQLKWIRENICEFKKEGHKIIVTNVLPNVTEKELIETYASADLRAKYLAEDWGVQDTKKFRQELKNYMDYEVKKGKYLVKEIYQEFTPNNYYKMQKGIYQYTIPLVLLNILMNNEPIVALTLHKWANAIDMVNENYDIVNYNRFTAAEVLSLTIELANDYCNRVNKKINLCIENTIKMLEEASLISYYKLPYVKLGKKTEVIKNGQEITVEYSTGEESNLFRRATKEETIDLIRIRGEAQNLAEATDQECYYGEKAEKFRQEYDRLLQEYNADRDLPILKFTDVYELVIRDRRKCVETVRHFNLTNLRENFNVYLSNDLLNNAYRRQKKNGEKYGAIYIEDFSTLIDVTIPIGAESLKDKERIKQCLESNKFIKVNHVFI